MLCIRRTLADGRLAGLVSGLGAATADAFYGSLVALGLTLVASFLGRHSRPGCAWWLLLSGGVSLLRRRCRVGSTAWPVQ